MTILMDEAIDVLRRIPGDRQDEIARAVLRLVASVQVVPVASSADNDERAASESDVAWTEFASNAAMRALWNK